MSLAIAATIPALIVTHFLHLHYFYYSSAKILGTLPIIRYESDIWFYLLLLSPKRVVRNL